MLLIFLTLLLGIASQGFKYKEKFNTIEWMGYQWYVKTSNGKKTGPGPNVFNQKTVKVEENQLTLSIVNQNEEWVCSELISKQKFKFGVFDWVVEGNVANLDKNVVFSMFLYPPSPFAAIDGTNQIDIQFAKWGKDREQNLDFTVFTRSNLKQKPISKSFIFNQSSTDLSAHRIQWNKNQLNIYSKPIYNDQSDQLDLNTRNYKFPINKNLIPQIPLRVHINLWLFKGQAPSQQLSLKLTHFEYTPLIQ